MQAALPTTFAGQRGRLFGLALKTSVLTVLSLGLYRFWMKTRIRRYYWSSIRPGEVPLEYVGEPLEKLLGFLIAVVLMAFYIGIVNLLLMFASFALFQGNFYAYAVSFVGVIPLIFFAQYRARRYVLARTRWRGIRFGVESGAWGYAGRALLWWLLTLLTLGILWPRKAFALEKYRIDRTFYGSARFHQGGNPWILMGAARHFVIGLGLGMIGLAGTAGFQRDPLLFWCFVATAALGWGWCIFGLVFYQVDAFRRLAAAKQLGDLRLSARPRPWRILRHYLFGYLLTLVVMSVILAPLVYGIWLGYLSSGDLLLDTLPADAAPRPQWLVAGIGVLVYFLVFILWGVFRQVFVTLPNLRHYAETLTLENSEALAQITQRARDDFAEAEGFADALDVGAAI
jgi:hypothetical protein